ncbi:uncharacterized protein AB675_11769 [Cyphellophora attinorum]|uniref:Uncharacterized protein n=1 Tax=Cyphellophora attinorum TaxID=1664694 RepID=A0A0N1HJT0_9EURO|nr:uncharacterized protein AB675_11769 [Phialophora attinorum]KPI36827.1 hypothetical protein AB675_11769 [Phialophora attinorum]
MPQPLSAPTWDKPRPNLASMPNEILRRIIDLAVPQASHCLSVNVDYESDPPRRPTRRRVEFLWHDSSDISVLFVTKAIFQVTRAILFERATFKFPDGAWANFVSHAIHFELEIEICIRDGLAPGSKTLGYVR